MKGNIDTILSDKAVNRAMSDVAAYLEELLAKRRLAREEQNTSADSNVHSVIGKEPCGAS